MSDASRVSASNSICEHLLASTLYQSSHRIGAYLAFADEANLATLIAAAHRHEKEIFVPRVEGRSSNMHFVRYRPDTILVRNHFGIEEPGTHEKEKAAPESLELVLMPLLAFDDFGNRLGMGAGYYDRFLGRFPRERRPRLIGLAHALQRSLDPLPFADWDVPLDGVITEEGWQALPAETATEGTQWQ